VLTSFARVSAVLVCLILAPRPAPAVQGGGSLRDAVGGGGGALPAATKKSAPKKSAPKPGPAAQPKAASKAASKASKTAAKASSKVSREPVRLVVREGTAVPLAFAEDLSSKSADEDDDVEFTLAEDLAVDGVVVARAGTPARGVVSKVKKAGRFGRDAKLSVRVEYLEVGDTKLGLRGAKTKDGDEEEGIGEAFDAMKGVFVKSENVEIKEGTVVTAYVAADTPVTVARH